MEEEVAQIEVNTLLSFFLKVGIENDWKCKFTHVKGMKQAASRLDIRKGTVIKLSVCVCV
jgi:hypothetical protein